MKKAKELYKELTDEIISLLENKDLSYNKPWITLDDFGGMARNALSGRMYSIINQIILGLQIKRYHYVKNAWLTYKQINNVGGHVKKGEKSTTIYFNTYTYKDRDGKKYQWDEVKEMSQSKREELGIESNYYLTSYRVFNIFQTENLPEIYHQLPTQHHTITFDVHSLVDELITTSTHEVDFIDKDIDAAFYDLDKDHIVLPKKEYFRNEEGYYATLFHEWVHWTGHKDRLDRSYLYGKGTENYAHEELIAELGSVFICAQLGLPKNMTQNAAYLQSWLKALKKDNRYIMRMVSYADRACKYILADFNIEEEMEYHQLQES